MENIMEYIYAAAMVITAIVGWVLKNKMKIKAIVRWAKKAFWIVEEAAIKSGYSTPEKIDLFKEKFTFLMDKDMYIVSEKDLKLALMLAEGIAAASRPQKKKEDPHPFADISPIERKRMQANIKWKALEAPAQDKFYDLSSVPKTLLGAAIGVRHKDAEKVKAILNKPAKKAVTKKKKPAILKKPVTKKKTVKKGAK